MGQVAQAQVHVDGRDDATAGPDDSAARATIPPEVWARHARWRGELSRWDQSYRSGVALVSDGEFDRRAEAVAALEARYPALADDDLASSRASGQWARAEPMGSLDRVRDRAGLQAWVAQLSVPTGSAPVLLLEPKLDGVALELVYDRGRLVVARTRGDGYRGRDVTDHVRGAAGVPESLMTDTPPERLDVRGELLVTRADLQRFAASWPGRPFPDGRSLAAGSLSLGDPDEARSRPLSVVVFGALGADAPGLETHGELLEQLERWGLTTLAAWRRTGTWEQLWDAAGQLGVDRDRLPWACDGAVIKLDDLAWRRRLGHDRGTPRWARALKFPGRQATTTVTAIHWSVGRTGALTPRAELEPVSIDGVRVAAAGLHGAAWLRRLGLCVGDRVLVERAGGAVPQLLAVVESAGGPAPATPSRCPRCDASIREERCPSQRCPAVLGRRLAHLASAQACDIRGLGPATCDRLVASGRVADLADLFELAVGDFEAALGCGVERARALEAAVRASRDTSWERLLVGLGVPGVGPATAGRLCRRFPDRESLWGASTEQLLAVTGVGPQLAQRLLDWRQEASCRAELERLLRLGLGSGAPRPGAARRRSDADVIEAGSTSEVVSQ